MKKNINEKSKNKYTNEVINDYIIDFDLFKVEEIIIIINFFRLIENTKTKKVSTNLLIEKYNEYRTILNNKSLEKKYDKMLLKKSNVSIYQIMSQIKM